MPEPTTPAKHAPMILWLGVLPAVLLLLALGVANWKVFHLAYCKHLFNSSDVNDQVKGTWLLRKYHLRVGMTKDEALDALRPLPLSGPTLTKGQWNEDLLYYGLAPKSHEAALGLNFDTSGVMVRIDEGK